MHEASTAIEFAELFFKHVKCCFETSQDIVINRNSQITFNFWHEVCEIQIKSIQYSGEFQT